MAIDREQWMKLGDRRRLNGCIDICTLTLIMPIVKEYLFLRECDVPF